MGQQGSCGKYGTIDPNSSPKDVWNSNELYRGYELTIFRTNFNKTKTTLGLQKRKRGGGTNILPACVDTENNNDDGGERRSTTTGNGRRIRVKVNDEDNDTEGGDEQYCTL